jgi:hypothetical protein
VILVLSVGTYNLLFTRKLNTIRVDNFDNAHSILNTVIFTFKYMKAKSDMQRFDLYSNVLLPEQIITKPTRICHGCQ